MPTHPAEPTHEAQPDRPVHKRNAAGVESPSQDQRQGASGLPHANADDEITGDQDIDTAGTAHDDQSPTKSL